MTIGVNDCPRPSTYSAERDIIFFMKTLEGNRLLSLATNITGPVAVALLGIDSDNDGVFINETLLRYCADHKVTFTRSRPYRKNDQAHVEQKNWSVVRRTIGYESYESEIFDPDGDYLY
jgi:hypothetical protein